MWFLLMNVFVLSSIELESKCVSFLFILQEKVSRTGEVLWMFHLWVYISVILTVAHLFKKKGTDL